MLHTPARDRPFEKNRCANDYDKCGSDGVRPTWRDVILIALVVAFCLASG
jgi:hypothetical protein